MEETPFAPHGGTRVELRGRTVVFRSSGDLNREEVQRLVAELGRIMPLGDQPWAILGVARKVVMLTGEAEQASREVVPTIVRQDLAAFAVAILEEKGRPMMEAQIQRIVKGECPLKFFDSEAEGQAWIDEMLADARG